MFLGLLDKGQSAVELFHLAFEQVHRRAADKAGHKDIFRLAVEGKRIGHLHDRAVTHDTYAVAHRHGLDLVVSHIHHRRCELGVQARNLRAHVHAHLGVQVGERLIEEEHLGVSHNGPTEGHPLALASGECSGLAVQHLLQPQGICRLGHRLLNEVLGLLGQLQAEGHVVKDRHVRIERVVLEHHRDPAVLGMDVIDHALPNGNRPAGDVLQPRQHPQGRRLPASARDPPAP